MGVQLKKGKKIRAKKAVVSNASGTPPTPPAALGPPQWRGWRGKVIILDVVRGGEIR